MHVTLTDVQNGEPVYLTRSLSGGLEVALCELTYYHQWYNIRVVGRVSNEHTAVLVPDEYYNARELDEEVFKPLGAKLHLDTHTGLLQLTMKRDNIMMRSELAKVLGFSQNTFEGAKMLLRNGPTRSGGTYTADEPHRLAVHREVYIHLAALSTSENLPTQYAAQIYSRRKRKTGCQENYIISSLAI